MALILKFSLFVANFLFALKRIVWFQKISIPPPWRELEIPEGWWGQKPRKFQRGEGVDGQIKFQMVQFDSVPTYSCSCKKIATYQL